MALCMPAVSLRQAHAVDAATYYPSGNIETVTDGISVYTFRDEDYYSYYVAGDPSHSHGQGRISAYDNENPDGSIAHSEYEYYGDTLNIRNVEKPFYDSAGMVSGVRLEDTFYDESYITHPRIATDSQGNTLISTLVLSDGLQWKAYLIKYDPYDQVLWRREFPVNTSAMNVVCDVDGSDNIYVVCAIHSGGPGDNDVAIYKYGPDGTLLDTYLRDLGGYDTVTDILVDAFGNSYVCGTSGDWPDQAVFIIKVTPELIDAWDDTYNTPYKDSAHYISADGAGNILLHGYSQDHPEYQYFEISYTPSGVRNYVGAGMLRPAQPGTVLGCWATGRKYEKIKTDNGDSRRSITIAYGKNSGISILEYFNEGEIDFFPPGYGGMGVYYFMDPVTWIQAGACVKFDNGVGIEASFGGESGEEFYIDKITGYDINTYWLLWDVEYEGQPGQYIAIQKNQQGEYYAYTFDPQSGDFETLMQSLILIGPVADPSLLELPELGNWWKWAAQNYVVPIFPPLSSDITYDGMDRVVQRIDHNPYLVNDPGMDTTYIYSWDSPAAGQVEVTIEYDYDRDGGQDLIYSAIYANGTDYDLSNMAQWELISENFYLTTYVGLYSLNMAGMPWHANEAPYFSTGAATCQMILNYIREGAGVSLYEGPAGQDEIYQYAKAPMPYGPELTPDEVDKALGHFDPYDTLVFNSSNNYDSLPGGNPYQGYNYTVDTYDPGSDPNALANYMRDICHWMAYTVTQENWWDDGVLVARPNTPAAIPIYGDTEGYGHWVVVKGCVTSENPTPEPHTNPWNTPNFTVYGFWMKDPLVTGIGQNTYATAAECEATYFKPLATSDAYDGLYVQVAEPPAEMSNARIEIPQPDEDTANLEFVGVEAGTKDCEAAPLVAMSFEADNMYLKYEPVIKKQSWRDLVDKYLLEDDEVVKAFEGAKMRKPILVKRPDMKNSDYYLVPFNSPVKGKRSLTSAVIILDANDGYFKGASWTDEPERFLKIREKEAIKLVKRYIKQKRRGEIKSLPGKPGKRFKKIKKIIRQKYKKLLRHIKDAEARLVWEPNNYSASPFNPYWEVDVNGYIWYITQDGEVIPEVGLQVILNETWVNALQLKKSFSE